MLTRTVLRRGSATLAQSCRAGPNNKQVSFFGLGNMGAHMARNLTKNGYKVYGFDVDPKVVKALGADVGS